MAVNFVFLFAAGAVLALALVFCLVNKPKKPLFTATTLIILIIFLLSTELINMGLSTPTIISLPQGFVNAMVGFLTAQNSPNTVTLEQAFNIYMYIDSGLIALCIISLIVEVRSIFTLTPKKSNEQSKKKEESKE
ncbi:MAG: hypothetical protein ACI4FO_06710 [Acutalibacteraceae bacterium]